MGWLSVVLFSPCQCPNSHLLLIIDITSLELLRVPWLWEKEDAPLASHSQGHAACGVHVKPLGHRRYLGTVSSPSSPVQQEEQKVSPFLLRSFRSLLPSTVMANGFFRPHSAVGQRPFPKRLKTTSRVRSLSYLPGTLPLPWVGLRRNLPTIQEEGPDDSRKELVSKTPAAGLPPGLTLNKKNDLMGP